MSSLFVAVLLHCHCAVDAIVVVVISPAVFSLAVGCIVVLFAFIFARCYVV